MLTKLELAENLNTPPEILALLAKDTEWYVRCMVAQNPSTSSEILALLAKDEDSSVSAASFNNLNFSNEY